MNEALRILNKKDFYKYIILFKLYIDSKGNAREMYQGNLKNEIRELHGDDFDIEIFNSAKNYLATNEYTNRFCDYLKLSGIDYFESWIRSFEKLSEEDTALLKKELPKPIFDFFKFTSGTTTVLSFINQILKIKNNLPE